MRGLLDRLAEQVSVTYYDLVLAVIPTVFVAALLVGTLLSVPPQAAIAGASLVGAIALADALFLNPPIPRR